MAKFSKGIQNFLAQVGANDDMRISMVPKSDSCGGPGDILFFRYKLGTGKGSRAFRIFLLTEPVTKDAKTGNQLLTGFKVPEDGTYTPESLESLYNNSELPEDGYRTYIMSNIFGPLRKISKNPPEVVE
jgi:hypothetical protein